MKKIHHIKIDRIIDLPEDGLLLGNGDLSCSFYQAPGTLIWRFGKSDCWDRRVAYELNPVPAHIKEMIKGIRDEKWCCGPYGGDVKALNGTDSPERMKEICQGSSPAMKYRDYPCPKPAGELRLHYPMSGNNFSIEQTLNIENAELTAICRWDEKVKLSIKCAIAPDNNVFMLDWKLENYTGYNRREEKYCIPVYFTLSRTHDRKCRDYGAAYNLIRGAIFPVYEHPGGDPMPPSEIVKFSDSGYYIEQLLPGEATFPDGLRTGLALADNDMTPSLFPVNNFASIIKYIPAADKNSGSFCTILESAGSREELQKKLLSQAESRVSEMRSGCRKAAKKFWSASSISLPEAPDMEELWYANLHARRCANRAGFLPAGLFFPSTVGDYSLWHGDYHLNYNLQQPFYGDYAANHPEIGDSYFEAMKYAVQMGKLIASRYYDSPEGIFFQLSTFPIRAEDDIAGCAPMGRMVYPTGWAGHQYFWRWRYTGDRKFLKEEAFPVLRGIAQFYLDFLKKESDGRYHAFPSNQGEDGFTGDPEIYRDLPQIMLHIRFALAAAETAAKELGENDFAQACRKRIDLLADQKKCAGEIRNAVDNWEEAAAKMNDISVRKWSEITESRGDLFPPEFLGWDGMVRKYADPATPQWLSDDFYTHQWYAGKFPSVWLTELRNRCFLPERDWTSVLKLVKKWKAPNGILRAMTPCMYGAAGAFTEGTGIIAPLQECLLTGHLPEIEIFPAIPSSWKNVSFENLRTFDGFLVSAKKENGSVSQVSIRAASSGRKTVKLLNPFGRKKFKSSIPFNRSDNVLSAELKQNEKWILEKL